MAVSLRASDLNLGPAKTGRSGVVIPTPSGHNANVDALISAVNNRAALAGDDSRPDGGTLAAASRVVARLASALVNDHGVSINDIRDALASGDFDSLRPDPAPAPSGSDS
jgi:hypothetical protein